MHQLEKEKLIFSFKEYIISLIIIELIIDPVVDNVFHYKINRRSYDW